MAKKTQAEVIEAPTESAPEIVREVRTRRKETRPSNEVFREKAGNRLRLFEYQLDALEQLCRGRVARPTPEQFAWLREWMHQKVEKTLMAIEVELARDEQAAASERGNVPVPI